MLKLAAWNSSSVIKAAHRLINKRTMITDQQNGHRIKKNGQWCTYSIPENGSRTRSSWLKVTFVPELVCEESAPKTLTQVHETVNVNSKLGCCRKKISWPRIITIQFLAAEVGVGGGVIYILPKFSAFVINTAEEFIMVFLFSFITSGYSTSAMVCIAYAK